MPEHDILISGHCVLCGTQQNFRMTSRHPASWMNMAWLVKCHACRTVFIVPGTRDDRFQCWNVEPVVGEKL